MVVIIARAFQRSGVTAWVEHHSVIEVNFLAPADSGIHLLAFLSSRDQEVQRNNAADMHYLIVLSQGQQSQCH